MNKARRTELDSAIAEISNASEALDTILSDEEAYYNDMPEAIQSGEKGEKSQEAIAAIEEAISSLAEATDQAEAAKG